MGRLLLIALALVAVLALAALAASESISAPQCGGSMADALPAIRAICERQELLRKY